MIYDQISSIEMHKIILLALICVTIEVKVNLATFSEWPQTPTNEAKNSWVNIFIFVFKNLQKIAYTTNDYKCKAINELSKGQIKPKADWRTIDSPKKRTNEFGFFALQSGNT